MADILCRNSYCIYYKDDKCMLSRISLNEASLCEECTLVTLGIDELEALRFAGRTRYGEFDE